MTKWENKLSDARRAHFVGRHTELERLDALCGDDEHALLHVWGPRGIGKTMLLLEWARRARQRGHAVLYIVGTAVSSARRDWIESITATKQGTVIVDDFDDLGELRELLRTVVLPELSTKVHVITAGRTPLPGPWLADDGWRSLSRMLRLDVLGTEESADYLSARGIVDDTDDILGSAAGHPLALCAAANSRLGNDIPRQNETAGRPEPPGLERPSDAETPRDSNESRNSAPGGPRLEREALASAVKDALRHFQDAPMLAEGALSRCRFVQAVHEGAHGRNGVDALRHALRTAIAALEPRDAKLLTATYLQGRTKQFAVACDLGMAYSTYRRHLARATNRLGQLCWRREAEADLEGKLIRFPLPPSRSRELQLNVH